MSIERSLLCISAEASTNMIGAFYTYKLGHNLNIEVTVSNVKLGTFEVGKRYSIGLDCEPVDDPATGT